ncbi:MAG: hypothetical protein K9M80_01555 [Candidatus Marinimicrobia bacterium]|nr:hypothetical protein [Candidatus Neomarinimicrobiota bacterium]
MKIKIPNKILDALDYIIMFDPVSLILVLLVTLAGYATQQMVVYDSPPWWVTGFNTRTLIAFISTFLCNGGILILNQLNHREKQIKASQLSPVENGNIESSVAKKTAVLAITIGLAALLLIQKLFLAGVIIVIFLVRGILHNFLKVSKKRKGGLWLVSNFIYALLLFIFGWLIKGTLQSQIGSYSLPYLTQAFSFLILILLMNGNMLYKTYKDGEEIVHMGDRKYLIWLSFALAVVSFVVGLKNNDPLITHSMLLSLVLYLILIFKLNHLWIQRTLSYSLLFFIFFISSQYPWFFLFAVVAYYLAKKYYKDRYEIQFPNFGNIEMAGEEND